MRASRVQVSALTLESPRLYGALLNSTLEPAHTVMRKEMAKSTQTNYRVARTALESFDPDALKNLVRDGLVSMKMADRGDFIQSLEREMKRANLNMRAYLLPLGIPARSAEDLTPTEVGHLIRFLKMIVPASYARC